MEELRKEHRKRWEKEGILRERVVAPDVTSLIEVRNIFTRVQGHLWRFLDPRMRGREKALSFDCFAEGCRVRVASPEILDIQ